MREELCEGRCGMGLLNMHACQMGGGGGDDGGVRSHAGALNQRRVAT